MLYEYRFTPPALAAAAGAHGNVTAALHPAALTPLQAAAIPAAWGRHWTDASSGVVVEVGSVWTRVLLREYLPPLERGNPSVQEFLRAHGYVGEEL